MAHPAADGGRARAHGLAGVLDRRGPADGDAPAAFVGSGIYVGLAASIVLVAFGFTIVIKRASQPYVVVDRR